MQPEPTTGIEDDRGPDLVRVGPSQRRLRALTVRWFFEPTDAAVLFWCSLVFIASLAILLWGIAAWPALYFDETWWVPAAREFIATGQMTQQQHPPLAKLLIGMGMSIFGDNALGWRVMSAVFGSLTLMGMFLWSYALFRHIGRSLWVTGVTLFDQFVYVQSRIGMLDIFVMAFCTFALAFFTFSLKERQSPQKSFVFAMLMGTCVGLASACKWSGWFLWFGIVGVALLRGVLRSWRVRFADPNDIDFFGDRVWACMTPLNAAVALALMPALAYALTYLPQMIHAGSAMEFFASHRRMFEIWSGNPGTHPYSSQWYDWPLLVRPMWYLFEVSGGAARWSVENRAHAVLALANPLIVFAGEIAIVSAGLAWLRTRSIDAMIVTVAFFAQYLPWAANPIGLEFSYYYFPPLLCTGPALALALLRKERAWGNSPALAFLGLAGLVFCFFLPILSAPIGVTPWGYAIRMWSASWR